VPGSPVTEIEGLLHRVADGDHRAFGELYDRMLRRVHGLALRVLRDPSQAEEVAQEVFLEVWQLAGRFDADRGGAAAWILHKTHCKAVDRVRSAAARTARDLRAGIRDQAASGDSLADMVELRIESERVGRALGRLPEEQRQAVTMSHLSGFTHTEVSRMLQIPLGTVKTRIRTGMNRLREDLAIAV
jgi:RNA polymerase sigma-70 factor (ECF subfamily)